MLLWRRKGRLFVVQNSVCHPQRLQSHQYQNIPNIFVQVAIYDILASWILCHVHTFICLNSTKNIYLDRMLGIDGSPNRIDQLFGFPNCFCPNSPSVRRAHPRSILTNTTEETWCILMDKPKAHSCSEMKMSSPNTIQSWSFIQNAKIISKSHKDMNYHAS